MNINGVEFFWGKEFLPEGKVFKPAGLLQQSDSGNLTSTPQHVENINQVLAEQAVDMQCNAIIIQDRTDIAAGGAAGYHSYFKSATTITGMAGLLVDKE